MGNRVNLDGISILIIYKVWPAHLNFILFWMAWLPAGGAGGKELPAVLHA
jgi:hypothetical protein